MEWLGVDLAIPSGQALLGRPDKLESRTISACAARQLLLDHPARQVGTNIRTNIYACENIVVFIGRQEFSR